MLFNGNGVGSVVRRNERHFLRVGLARPLCSCRSRHHRAPTQVVIIIKSKKTRRIDAERKRGKGTSKEATGSDD